MQKLLRQIRQKGARLFFSVLGFTMVFSPSSNNSTIEATRLKFNDMPSHFFEASLGRNDIELSENKIEAKYAFPEGKLAAITEFSEAGENATPQPEPKPEVLAVTHEVSTYTEVMPQHEVVQYIIKYSQEYGVNTDVMLKIAECESGFNENAVNGPFGGLYQFLASTWASNRNAMGLDPNPDLRFNGEEATRTAAFKMSQDGFGAWPACSQKAIREI